MEPVLAWGHEAQAALASGMVRFPALLRACHVRLRAQGLADIFLSASHLHAAGLDAALNVHLSALCEHCTDAVCAGADGAAWLALASFLARLTGNLCERSLGIILQLAPTCLACATLPERMQELVAQAAACARGALAQQGRLPFLAAKLCALVQVPAAALAAGQSLQLLRCAVAARHWLSVRFLLTAHFAPGAPGREEAFAQSLCDAGDGRFASLLHTLRGGAEASTMVGPAAAAAAAASVQHVRASSALSVFNVHPFKQHSSVPLRLAPPHPQLLLRPEAAGGGSEADTPGSALVGLIAQGHASAPAELHTAHPPIAQWKQRSLRHLVLVLQDLPLACALALGDASARLYLMELLHSLHRVGDARAAAAAFGCSAEEVQTLEAALTGSGGSEGSSSSSSSSSSGSSSPVQGGGAGVGPGEQHFWRVPLLFTAWGPAATAAAAAAAAGAASYLVTPVNTCECLAALLAELEGALQEVAGGSAPCLLLGLDTEHRPLSTPAHPLSLLQLAMGRRCWLVDLLQLHAGGAQAAALLAQLGARVLCHPSVRCLGWGIREDLKRLLQSHPSLFSHAAAAAPAAAATVGAVDLQEVARTLPSHASSLSSLVQGVLGLPLDKKEQVSDWQLRPLSYSQQYYAALDAISAVAIFERLCSSSGKGVLLDKFTFFWPCTALQQSKPSAGTSSSSSSSSSALLYPPHTYVPLVSLEQPLGPWECVLALQALGLDPQRCLPWKSTHAATSAAAALAVKTLACMVLVEGEGAHEAPALLVLPKQGRASSQGLPGLASWRLASAGECVRMFGWLPGTFPPLLGAYRASLRQGPSGLRVLVDAAVAGWEGELVGGGGSPDHSLVLSSALELLRAMGRQGVRICALCEPGSQGCSSSSSSSSSAPASPLPSAAPPPPTAVHITIPPPKLLCDSSLGRLTRWLRVIGVDAESRQGWSADKWLAARRGGGGGELAALCMTSDELVEWANETHRIVLTRDAKVLSKRVGCYFVASNDCAAQFVDVCDNLGIRVRPEDLMARCANCNGLGYEELTPAQAKARDEEGIIPAKILQNVVRFWACLCCPKIYWEGSKFDDSRHKYSQIFSQVDAQ